MTSNTLADILNIPQCRKPECLSVTEADSRSSHLVLVDHEVMGGNRAPRAAAVVAATRQQAFCAGKRSSRYLDRLRWQAASRFEDIISTYTYGESILVDQERRLALVTLRDIVRSY